MGPKPCRKECSADDLSGFEGLECVHSISRNGICRLSNGSSDEDKGWTGHIALLFVNGAAIDFLLSLRSTDKWWQLGKSCFCQVSVCLIMCVDGLRTFSIECCEKSTAECHLWP